MEVDSEAEQSEKQRKLYFMVEALKEMHSKLSSFEIQSRIPLENLSMMANVLLEDSNIFEIITGLRDCQNAAEKLWKKRRDEQILAHQSEMENWTRSLCESELAHTVALAKVQHERKLKEIDKNIITELDAVVLEQQQTLSLLNVPGFYETSDNKTIITQMHLFSFLLRLQRLLETQN